MSTLFWVLFAQKKQGIAPVLQTYSMWQGRHCLFEQKITSICTTMFVFRRLLPAYSSLARFPQLIFTKDNSAEYKAEMEHLLNKAKLNDTGFGGEWGWNQEKLMRQDLCHSRILVVYHQQFFRNFDLKTSHVSAWKGISAVYIQWPWCFAFKLEHVLWESSTCFEYSQIPP